MTANPCLREARLSDTTIQIFGPLISRATNSEEAAHWLAVLYHAEWSLRGYRRAP